MGNGCAGTDIRRQLCRISSLCLPSRGVQGLNLGCQACAEGAVITKLPHWPVFSSLKATFMLYI